MNIFELGRCPARRAGSAHATRLAELSPSSDSLPAALVIHFVNDSCKITVPCDFHERDDR